MDEKQQKNIVKMAVVLGAAALLWYFLAMLVVLR
jgi:hypothetical protein